MNLPGMIPGTDTRYRWIHKRYKIQRDPTDIPVRLTVQVSMAKPICVGTRDDGQLAEESSPNSIGITGIIDHFVLCIW